MKNLNVIGIYEDFEEALEKGDSASMRAAVRGSQEVRKDCHMTQEYECIHMDDTPTQNSLTIQNKVHKTNN